MKPIQRLLIINLIIFAVFPVACKPRAGASDPASVDQNDPAAYGYIEDHFDFDGLKKWEESMTPEQKDPVKIRAAMDKAAKEFKVPVELLMAIAHFESKWVMIGPSIDQGWGMMHLVEDNLSNTLGRAADLLKLPAERLKSDMHANIRGMAALIAHEAGATRAKYKKLEDWFPAVKAVTGLKGGDLQTEQAIAYYNVLKSGVKAEEFFGKAYTIPAVKNLNLKVSLPSRNEEAAEYPEAIRDYIPQCNYTAGRNKQKVTLYVNHYIAMGTVNGTRSYFKKCPEERSKEAGRAVGASSAHFLVTQDGTVYQFRPSTDSTYHAGAKNKATKANFPWNNYRSIGVEHESIVLIGKNLTRSDETAKKMWQSEKMLEASAKLANFYAKKYGIPKVHTKGDNYESGIRGHQEMPAAQTDCPGPLPWDTWMQKLTSLK